MTENSIFSDNPGHIVDEPIGEALSKRYLAYALSTITSRALPDVRDGLKPVHRRLLYAMRELNLDPDAAFKKCARVVGDVMGRFHPHGDQAIYDALVRLAQDFTVRFPLIDGQGNFGNIDGDNAAAMRYTESRLTKAAESLLAGLDENAIDFRATYDGQDKEPIVLPAGYPNLLANGAAGIAVGMATQIPPHNAAELIDACQMLLFNPDASTRDLLRVVRGPDFPTGGVVIDPPEAILQAYETGRGSFRIRANWEIEELARGMWRIVITQLPFQVPKAKLIADLANLIELKKAPLLGDVRDESTDVIRLVLEPKTRSVEPDMLMESLFKLSELEVRFGLNMNVLDARQVPRVMGLKDALDAFLDHRLVVLRRRTAFRLDKIAARLDVLAALLIVYLNLDEVIAIIRTQDEPKPVLIKRFKLNETQAEAILNTRLRSLRKLEEMEIRLEDAALRAEQAGLAALLKDPDAQRRRIGEELAQTRKIFDPDSALGRRRTRFSTLAEAPTVSAEAFVAREPITLVLTHKGWLRALRGHVEDVNAFKVKDGDSAAFIVQAETTDRLLLLASDGRVFTLRGDQVPGGRGAGEPIRLLLDMGEGDTIVSCFPYRAGTKRLIASQDGYGFIAAEDDMLAQKRSGKQVLSGTALTAALAQGDHVAVLSAARKLLIFPLDELPEMARGKGVRLQMLKEGALADVLVFSAADGLAWTDAAGRQRQLPEWRDWLGKRGQAGKLVPKGFPRSGTFSG